MRRMIWLLATVLAACGSVQDRAGCAASADCPAGEYCAHTADGNVCWPDGQPPAVSDVTVACGTCLRDGTVTVSAVVTDDHDVGAVEASLDLDPARTVPLTLSGGRWTARVPLGAWPFPAFARPVRATVVARDGARNASAPASADSPAVTRLRWQRAVDGVVVALTPPAIMDDGTIVVGGSTGKLYFVSPTGVNAHDPLPVGTGQITAAPAIGQRAIWVGSEDFSIYGVKLDGSGVIPGVSLNTDGAVKGAPAVWSDATQEWGLAASMSGR
ncbi:MAG TPA: PQQ-binding-like beta-propeller repeat protein, partial [Anaeromyxobacter sp.]|nr:PQQ-binding-like beta-propeller repeat protein [Anaeromyxobacter sp.]